MKFQLLKQRKFNKKEFRQKGQVILLTLLFIGSSILIFSAVAGYIMIQRIRAVSDTIDSTKAVFAADSGVECMIYKYSSTTDPIDIDCNTFLVFDDTFVSVYTEFASSSTGTPLYIKSVGTSNKSKRAFYVGF